MKKDRKKQEGRKKARKLKNSKMQRSKPDGRALFLRLEVVQLLKIRRVDDKRMVIHTKARAKVHIKCRQGMKIKRAGSYAVQGISDVNSKKTDNKTASYRISDNKKLLQGKKPAVLAEVPEKNVQHITGGIQSRQAAVLAVPHDTQDKTDYKKDVRKCINRENEMYARHQKNRTGKGCIKKTAVLKIAKKTASYTVLNQIEGGDELKDSCTVTAVMAVPAMDAAKAGKHLCQLKAAKIKEQKIRKVQAISRIKQRETADYTKMAGSDTVKQSVAVVKSGNTITDDAESVKQDYHIQKTDRQKEAVKITLCKPENRTSAKKFPKQERAVKQHWEKNVIKPANKERETGISLPVKRAMQNENDRPGQTIEPAKVNSLNAGRQKRIKPPVNEAALQTGNHAAEWEKTEEKKTAEKNAQSRHMALKKVSVQKKMKQRQGSSHIKSEITPSVKHCSHSKTADKKEKQNGARKRMVQLFTDRLRKEENQENAGKLAKDIVRGHFFIMAKQAVRYVGVFFMSVAVLVAIVILPVLLVTAILYNSPFAIFFPSISSGDTTQDVLSAYVEEFNQEVDREVSDCRGYSSSRKVYVDAPAGQIPDNYYDILAVYMVKHGIGDTAIDMTDRAKEKLQTVFDDMCSYYITTSTRVVSFADGSVIVYTIKNVNVVLKSWEDMVSVYNFGQEEQEFLAEIMEPENLSLLGYSENGGGGSPGAGILPEQYQAVLDSVSDENGRKVLEFALSKVGYPYSQPLRDSGTHFDCSSLAYYAWKNAGVDIMYHGANTAAAEGQYCYDNNLLVHYEEMQPGDLIFYSYQRNGRFMDISHVAVYAGNGMVVEAANTNLGVVYRPVQGRNSIVLIGRPR